MMTRTAFRQSLLTAGVVAGMVSVGLGSALAEERFFGAKTPSVSEFVEGLKPAQKSPSAMRMRGIKPTSSATQAAAPELASEPAAVSMQLRFGFNSAELSEESKMTLDNLSAALKSSDLNTFTFLIEGHTDATGSDSYNLDLSSRRANSVMNYLVDRHGVDPSRLRAVGKGETALLDANRPASGANRRVAVVNMGAVALGSN